MYLKKNVTLSLVFLIIFPVVLERGQQISIISAFPLLAPPEPGVSVDYVHNVLKVNASYTIELRDRVKYMFLLPADQIEPSSLETFDGLVDAINEIEKARNRNMVTLDITQNVTNSKNNKHKHTFESFLWTVFYFIKNFFPAIASHQDVISSEMNSTYFFLEPMQLLRNLLDNSSY